MRLQHNSFLFYVSKYQSIHRAVINSRWFKIYSLKSLGKPCNMFVLSAYFVIKIELNSRYKYKIDIIIYYSNLDLNRLQKNISFAYKSYIYRTWGAGANAVFTYVKEKHRANYFGLQVLPVLTNYIWVITFIPVINIVIHYLHLGFKSTCKY